MRTEKRPLNSPLKARERRSRLFTLAHSLRVSLSPAAQATKMEPSSLLNMSLRAVYDNFEKYDKDLVKIILGTVRPNMLEIIFQIDEDHYEICNGQENHIDKIWAMLSFLFKSNLYAALDIRDLTYMDCDCPALSNSRFQEFIRCLGENAPNMRDLMIHGELSQLEYSLEGRELDSIIQLKNLVLLDIEDVFVPLSGVLGISRRCEKLERIKATDVKIDEELSSATFRDDFVYIYIDAYNFFSERMYLIMLTTMPTCDPKYATNTKYIEVSLRPHEISNFSFLQGIANEITDLQFSCIILGDIKEMEEFLHLPEIKYAKIDCFGESAHALRCFMKRNGDTLQELTLEDVHIKENMSFGEIFNFCPNLQSLQLNDCNLSGNDAPVDAMQQLKQFRWKHVKDDSSDAVAFSSVLSAPLLEELYIDLPNINFSDNATVIARIARSDILQNLKKFEMVERTEFNPEDMHENIIPYLRHFTELNNAIAALIA